MIINYNRAYDSQVLTHLPESVKRFAEVFEENGDPVNAILSLLSWLRNPEEKLPDNIRELWIQALTDHCDLTGDLGIDEALGLPVPAAWALGEPQGRKRQKQVTRSTNKTIGFAAARLQASFDISLECTEMLIAAKLNISNDAVHKAIHSHDGKAARKQLTELFEVPPLDDPKGRLFRVMALADYHPTLVREHLPDFAYLLNDEVPPWRFIFDFLKK